MAIFKYGINQVSLGNLTRYNNNQTRGKKYISLSTMIIIAFMSVFFPRCLSSFGAPSLVNFIHFIVVPIVFLFSISGLKLHKNNQVRIINLLNMQVTLFFICIVISALLNEAGLINAILSFILWVEPFLMLLAILCLPTNIAILSKIKRWVSYSLYFHTLLAFIQRFIFNLHTLDGLADNIQGVFYRSGAGHVVGASVALSFGIYLIFSCPPSISQRYLLRVFYFICAFTQMLLSDAKQVIFSFAVAGCLLIFTGFKNIYVFARYLLTLILTTLLFVWCVNNLEAFNAFKTWIRPEIYTLDGEATLLKTAVFRIAPTHFNSLFNIFFGLGPGHTVDRLGGWMLQEYSDLLMPLGATIHPISAEIWRVTGASWLGDQSSMFSPLFGWAAIWGDFGLVGLTVYTSIFMTIFFKICTQPLSKFLLLSVCVFGFVFSQLQEPGYTITIAVLIGMLWHEDKIKNAVKNNRL